MTLGDNIPANSSDSADEVTDILPIQAKNSTGGMDTFAWEYVTKNADYLELNPTFNDFWSTFVSGFAPWANAWQHAGVVGPTSSQWVTVMNYITSHNGYVGRCFTASLPLG